MPRSSIDQNIFEPPPQGEPVNRSFWFWCTVTIGLHAVLLAAPPVNLEFAFYEGARSLVAPDYAEGAQRYFAYQANPLGYSMLTAGLWRVLHLPPSYWSLRLWSLVGALLILYSGREWFRLLRPQSLDLFNLWAGVTTLCPLVWIYAGRGTADVLPAGLLCLALTWCWKAEGRLRYHLLAGSVFALAAIVKFNVLLVGLGFVVIIAREPTTGAVRLRNLACYTVLPAAALTAYFAWLRAHFGILLVADNFKTIHDPLGYINHFWAVLALYLSYLAMLPGLLTLRPLAHLSALRTRGGMVIAAGCAVLVAMGLGVALDRVELGEMKFGVFDHLLPPLAFAALRGMCLLLALVLVAEILFEAFARRDAVARVLAASIVPFLIVSSCSRPAQRYLLVCLPLVLFYLIATTPERLRVPTRLLGWMSVLLFAGMSFVGSIYGAAQGRAAEQMAQWIEEHGYTADTASGAIEAHAAHHFPLHPGPTHFHVSTSPLPGALHEEPVWLLGRRLRTYYFYPNDVATAPTATQEVARRPEAAAQ